MRESIINERRIGSVEVKAETFSWDVACSLGEFKTYGIKIADEATKGITFQYSFPFEIKGPSVSDLLKSNPNDEVEYWEMRCGWKILTRDTIVWR